MFAGSAEGSGKVNWDCKRMDADQSEMRCVNILRAYFVHQRVSYHCW